MGILTAIDEVVGTDFDRLAQRRETRKQVAIYETRLDRGVAIENGTLADLDAEAETAAANHVETCAKIQREIAEIEDQISSAVADRLPIPKGLDERRIKLLGQISENNKTLETIVERVKKMREPLVKEVQELKNCSGHCTVARNKLALFPLANPQLLNQLHATKCELKFIELRIKAAEDHQWRAQTNCSMAQREDWDSERTSAVERDLSQWQFELAQAEKARAAAIREIETLRQKMLDE